MRFEQLDLNLLVALDILLEEQNITRSAARLHLSQSATSGILSRLREYFEDDLLVQVGKKMLPTPFALELQGPVAGVLATIRGAIIGKKINNPEQSNRHFRVIASDYVIQALLVKVLPELEKVAPNITFEFLSPFAHEVNILDRGGADMMIAPETVVLSHYSSVPVISDKLVCVANKDNPLIDGEMTIDKFKTLGHVSVGFAKASHLSIERWLVDTMGISRKVEVITNDFSTMLHTMLNSNRIAMLPKRFVELHLNNPMLQVVGMPFEAPTMKMSMMWHTTLDNDPMHRWLRDKIIASAKAL
ncbi:LysR family transcriptional regulator [Shewanella sp. UCD-KL21]|uniref:LysR family transcriptional regulator n=1 Tax=Shewanella sp. UCD-KL21 TaxID=1917164 RepID=UPI000970D9FB|nr:LysR family transcriptional regulator [Shewanella sp. UCD-KL21]